jgi:hypothetical protein
LDYDYNDRKQGSVYSRKLRAGKRRTYFFDVRETRGSDFFVTITETRKRFNDDGFERQKIFIYKEDFNKFTAALGEAIMHVKTELMPDFDFDHYNHEDEREEPRYRQPKNRSGYHNKGAHQYNNEGHHLSRENKQQIFDLENNEEQRTGEEQVDAKSFQHESAVQDTEQITEPPTQMQPTHEVTEAASDYVNTADIQAEPMHEPQPEPDAGADSDDNLVNANSGSDKLASEEVEKW